MFPTPSTTMTIPQKLCLCAIFVLYAVSQQMPVTAQTATPLRDLTVGNRFMYRAVVDFSDQGLSASNFRSNMTVYGYEDVLRDSIINGNRYSLVFSSADTSYHWERSNSNAIYLWRNGAEIISHRLKINAGESFTMLPFVGIGCLSLDGLPIPPCTFATHTISSLMEGTYLENISNYSSDNSISSNFSAQFQISYIPRVGIQEIISSSYKSARRICPSGSSMGECYSTSMLPPLYIRNYNESVKLIGSRIQGVTNGIADIPIRVRISDAPVFVAPDTLEVTIACESKTNEDFGAFAPSVELAYDRTLLRQLIFGYYSNRLEQDSSGRAGIALPKTITAGQPVKVKLRFYVLSFSNTLTTFQLQNFKQSHLLKEWLIPEVTGFAERKTILLRRPDLIRLNATVRMPQVNATSRKRTTVPMRLTGNLREAFENGITTVQTALLIDSAICDYSLVARASDGRGRIPITFRLSGSSDTAYTEVSATFLANAQRATSSGFTDTLSVTTGTMTAEPVSLTRGLVTFTVRPERPASVQVVVPTLRPTIVLPRLEATAGERLTIGMTMTGLDTLNQYYLPSTIEFGLRFNASLLEPLDGLASELSLQNSTRTIYRYLFSGNNYAYQPNSELSFVVRGAFGNDTATSLGATIRTQDGGIRIVPTVQQGSVRMRGNTAGGAFRFYSPKNRLLMTINPNPIQDVATLSYITSEQGIMEIAVFNTLGTKVFTKSVISESKAAEERLDFWGLPPGVYSVRILSGTSSDALQIVKL